MPSFESVREDEHDIFIYSGHISPGKHTLYLYDPLERKYFKKDNLLIYPNLYVQSNLGADGARASTNALHKVIWDQRDLCRGNIKRNLEFKTISTTIYGFNLSFDLS